ncbi:MAG TPA: glycosyltransferase WbuB [Anaerolineae bacterium]|nr:glycosyltransferase WbuB [Anaerolineae bacterium]
MHILLLTAYFPPDNGSAANLFYELGSTFVEMGHTVSVVTGFPSYHAQGDLSQYHGRRWMRETMVGMEVYRIVVPQIARNTPVGRGLWQFSAAFSYMLAGFKVPKADVALVYSPPLPLGLSALVWRALKGVPFVFNVQDLFPQSAIDLGILRMKPLIRFFQTLERFTYKRANTITVHSQGNWAYVVAHGGRPDSTVVMHNAVDTNHIQPGPKENDLRQELGLNGRFIASFAGVMGYSQDLDVILQAAQLLRERTDIHFLLVGEGVEKERLVAKSQEMGLSNVTWLPMQLRERYPAILHASDVGLATLHADVKTPVVPSKILSIMAGGRPVIAMMNLDGDAPKLIADAEAGFALEPGNPELLAKTLGKLYEDSALCERMGRNGRDYAVNQLSQTAMARRYSDLFTKILSRPGATKTPLPEKASTF